MTATASRHVVPLRSRVEGQRIDPAGPELIDLVIRPLAAISCSLRPSSVANV